MVASGVDGVRRQKPHSTARSFYHLLATGRFFMAVKPMERRYTTCGPHETRELGRRCGEELRPGDLVTLCGPLGAGKTTFTQGLARALDVTADVVSPTFVLIVEHAGRVPLLHLDAYRLENMCLENMCYDAVRDAGVLDFLDRMDAVKLVEWPERIEEFLPAPRLAVTIALGPGENERQITIRRQEAESREQHDGH